MFVRKSKTALIVAALSAGVAALSCQTQALARDMTIAVPKNPDNLDPPTENSNPNLRIMLSLYDTLVRFDYRHGGKIIPGLATSWKVVDGKTIEFKLRPGVVFHNGDTFDADDVVATFEPERRGLDKTVVVQSNEMLGGIESVEVIDKMTVRIHMSAVDPIALDRFAAYPSQIISETAVKQAKTYADFTKLDAGSGPYSLESFQPSATVVLKKFDRYWGDDKAAADKVTFVQVPELSTRVAGLLSGQFDLITEIGTDEFPQIEGNPNGGVAGGSLPTIRGVVFDSIDSPIADPRIRQAMNLAIDRVGMVKSLYDGRTEVPHGWQHETFRVSWPGDRLSHAAQLLHQAGRDRPDRGFDVEGRRPERQARVQGKLDAGPGGYS
jgi:peptide/nickel transport system substrate-binding protein